MTDRELLESAARAAGWEGAEFQDMRGWGEVRHGFSEALWVPELERYVNPLDDDGDALRLAVKLRIRTGGINDRAYTFAGLQEFWEPEGEDPYAAARRCIVRAAAAIGEKVK